MWNLMQIRPGLETVSPKLLCFSRLYFLCLPQPYLGARLPSANWLCRWYFDPFLLHPPLASDLLCKQRAIPRYPYSTVRNRDVRIPILQILWKNIQSKYMTLMFSSQRQKCLCSISKEWELSMIGCSGLNPSTHPPLCPPPPRLL